MLKTVFDFINRVNLAIANTITNMVGTMWCAYLFSIMVSIPLFYPSTNTLITFISSSLLQLILLPLLMVGQGIQGRAAEIRAKKDHKMIREELALLRQQVAAQETATTYITEIHARIVANDPS